VCIRRFYCGLLRVLLVSFIFFFNFSSSVSLNFFSHANPFALKVSDSWDRYCICSFDYSVASGGEHIVRFDHVTWFGSRALVQIR